MFSRRLALQLGAYGLFGGLASQLEASPKSAKATSCIFLFLEGGPPHMDMFDPKPESPSDFRGPFKTISTNVPGTFLSEHLPSCSKIADKYTIIRSHSHNDNGHTTGYHYVMTGHKPNFADGDNPVPNNDTHPSMGSIISRGLGPKGPMPSYINLPHPMAAGGPGFYGAQHAPFVIESDPSQPDFEVRDLFPSGSKKRQNLRNKLLANIDDLESTQIHGPAKTLSEYYKRAYTLINSDSTKKVFNIGEESSKTREMYGYTQVGQCALLGRRLIEGGCRFVGIDSPGWDVHFNCFPSLSNDLIPPTDRAFAALITDLEERGMLDETLVVMMGEMGRTPRINAMAGRDHWSMAQSVIMAGGGIRAGQVIGKTDANATAPVTRPIGVQDLLRTIVTLVGIDPEKIYYDQLGRPHPIAASGEVIKELI